MAEISVVVPARNAERFLGEALRSIVAQTLRPLEVIVVDDDSSDRTAEIAVSYGATVLAHASQRPARARNAGIAHARGDVLAFLDADDRWGPAKLERQMAVLDAHPEIGFAGCHTSLFLDDPASPPPWWRQRWSAGTAEPSLLPSAVLVRRSAFERVGTYDETLALSDDVEWTARAQDAGIARVVLDDVLMQRRIHGAAASRDHAVVAASHLALLRTSIQRKRAARDA